MDNFYIILQFILVILCIAILSSILHPIRKLIAPPEPVTPPEPSPEEIAAAEEAARKQRIKEMRYAFDHCLDIVCEAEKAKKNNKIN